MKRFVWRTSFELLKAPVLNLEIGTGGLDRNRFFTQLFTNTSQSDESGGPWPNAELWINRGFLKLQGAYFLQLFAISTRLKLSNIIRTNIELGLRCKN